MSLVTVFRRQRYAIFFRIRNELTKKQQILRSFVAKIIVVRRLDVPKKGLNIISGKKVMMKK